MEISTCVCVATCTIQRLPKGLIPGRSGRNKGLPPSELSVSRGCVGVAGDWLIFVIFVGVVDPLLCVFPLCLIRNVDICSGLYIILHYYVNKRCHSIVAISSSVS